MQRAPFGRRKDTCNSASDNQTCQLFELEVENKLIGVWSESKGYRNGDIDPFSFSADAYVRADTCHRCGVLQTERKSGGERH